MAERKDGGEQASGEKNVKAKREPAISVGERVLVRAPGFGRAAYDRACELALDDAVNRDEVKAKLPAFKAQARPGVVVSVDADGVATVQCAVDPIEDQVAGETLTLHGVELTGPGELEDDAVCRAWRPD